MVGEDGVRKQDMNEAQQLRANEPVDGNFQCQDVATKGQIADGILKEQFERLWKTDCVDSVVSSSVSLSTGDKRALEKMERSLKMVDGHCQVALPDRKSVV